MQKGRARLKRMEGAHHLGKERKGVESRSGRGS